MTGVVDLISFRRSLEVIMARLFKPVPVLAPLALLVFAMAAMPTPAKAIDIQRVVSPGGIEAWLVEDYTVPLIKIGRAHV